MSVHVSSWVWKNSEATGGDLLVLLAIADMANDTTAMAWPSQQSLAERSRLSDRQVRRCLTRLEEAGEILLRGTTKYGTKVYAVSGYLAFQERVDKMSTVETGRAWTPTSASPGHERPAEVDTDVLLTVIESSTEPSGGSVAPSQADVKRVYDHWRQARGKIAKNYDTMSPGRRKKLQTRLREFSADDLCAAIDNIASDPWPERALHDDITIIFRSHEHVEKFLEIGRLAKTVGKIPAKGSAQSAEQWVKATGWQYPDADLWEELGRFELLPEQKRQLVDLAIQLQKERAA